LSVRASSLMPTPSAGPPMRPSSILAPSRTTWPLSAGVPSIATNGVPNSSTVHEPDGFLTSAK